MNILKKSLLMASTLILTLCATSQATATTTHTITTNYVKSGTDQGHYFRVWKANGFPNNGGTASITVGYTSSTYNAKGQFGGSWSNGTDVIIGKGQAVGTYNQVINYSVGGLTVSNGSWFFGSYGWLNNSNGLPIEYYVEENSNISHSGTSRGSYTSDGATYKIYVFAMPGDGKPTTWYQVRSVRQTKASIGSKYNHTITMANHYANWAGLGRLSWTSHQYGIFCVEDYNFTGHAAKGSISATIW